MKNRWTELPQQTDWCTLWLTPRKPNSNSKRTLFPHSFYHSDQQQVNCHCGQTDVLFDWHRPTRNSWIFGFCDADQLRLGSFILAFAVKLFPFCFLVFGASFPCLLSSDHFDHQLNLWCGSAETWKLNSSLRRQITVVVGQFTFFVVFGTSFKLAETWQLNSCIRRQITVVVGHFTFFLWHLLVSVSAGSLDSLIRISWDLAASFLHSA